MSNPDQIRADIEVTRDELGRDVDALADKVSPPKIMERQKTRARQVMTDVKGRVMGVADDLGDSASSTGHTAGQAVGTAGDAVRDLPNKARQTTQGAPLVVGLLAAGVGFLVASLIPTTDAETRWSTALRDKAQPLVDKAVNTAKDAAHEVAEGLKGPAQDAAQQVKDSAVASAETVKEEAQSTAERVKENVTENVSPSSGDGAAATTGSESMGQTGTSTSSDPLGSAESDDSPGWHRLG
ncbi:DUF3618 domain-containing protein [Microbacterium sp. LWS13-1.2]|uniref:DUF3618 domain-containing protein n=1 Tax=Microbacterium sp. LWS13-1.2 TaxID=3135264 RepID=A0AAU6SF04_9MICO